MILSYKGHDLEAYQIAGRDAVHICGPYLRTSVFGKDKEAKTAIDAALAERDARSR